MAGAFTGHGHLRRRAVALAPDAAVIAGSDLGADGPTAQRVTVDDEFEVQAGALDSRTRERGNYSGRGDATASRRFSGHRGAVQDPDRRPRLRRRAGLLARSRDEHDGRRGARLTGATERPPRRSRRAAATKAARSRRTRPIWEAGEARPAPPRGRHLHALNIAPLQSTPLPFPRRRPARMKSSSRT